MLCATAVVLTAWGDSPGEQKPAAQAGGEASGRGPRPLDAAAPGAPEGGAAAADRGTGAFDVLVLGRLAEALAAVNLSIGDLSWDKRPISDRFRLSCVNETLDRPLSLADRALLAEQEFGAGDALASVTAAARWLDLPSEVSESREGEPAARRWLDPPSDGTARGEALAGSGASPDAAAGAGAGAVASGTADGRSSPADLPDPGEACRGGPVPPLPKLTGAPREAAAILARLGEAYREAECWRERAMAPLDPSERALIAQSGARLYTDTTDEDWDMKPVLDAAAKVDLASLWRAARTLALAAGGARRSLAGIDARRWKTRTWRSGDLTLGLGGPGADRHAETIVLDGGGDDIYAGGAIVVDVAGDDLYRDAGPGYERSALVLDLAGNDRYLGADFAEGGTAFGASLLIDASGDDRYEADQVGQGAAFFGVGMLLDLAGSDAYRGARFVQGFGGTRGLGLLSDREGDDTYYAGGKYRHAPLLPENYQSLSQGFGFGLRGASASGGIGILADGAGNDLYAAEVFGQGASYWFALGILVDSAGHDKYNLYQYGQGAGIHLSSGVLFDRAGNDAYSCNNGVAQGSGHDWGTGLLWDLAGDDCYQGSGMSQGGANANGIGMLIDAAGNDSYAGWNVKNQGDSFFARGTIGLGLLLDLAGTDRYTHGGKDGALWTRGTVGVGYDVAPPPAPPSPALATMKDGP